MGSARLVFTLALWVGLAEGIPSGVGSHSNFQVFSSPYQRGGGGHGGAGGHGGGGGHGGAGGHGGGGGHHQPAVHTNPNVVINAVSGPAIPNCPPEINEITQLKTVTQTRDVYTTQAVPEVHTRTVYNTNVVTQTSNVVETVTTTIQIRSNIQEVETSRRVQFAYTVVPTTVTETTTRTQFSIQYVTETSVLIRQVVEAQEEIVPVYVTQTAYGVNPVTRTRTDAVTVDRAIDVTVTFTEQTVVPVLVTETETLQVPAITSTVVNYVTQIVQNTQQVPVERVVTHREIHTRFLTEHVQGPSTVVLTVFHTACPIGGSAALGVPLSGPIPAVLPDRLYTVVPGGPATGGGVALGTAGGIALPPAAGGTPAAGGGVALGGAGGIALPINDYLPPAAGGDAVLGGPGGIALPSTDYGTPQGTPLAATPALNYGTPN